MLKVGRIGIGGMGPCGHIRAVSEGAPVPCNCVTWTPKLEGKSGGDFNIDIGGRPGGLRY